MKLRTILVLTLLIAGCGAKTRDLKATAASDFNCPTADIKLHKGSHGSREATGCGQTASYHYEAGEWTREGGGSSSKSSSPSNQPSNANASNSTTTTSSPATTNANAVAPAPANSTGSAIVVNGKTFDDKKKQEAVTFFGQAPSPGQWWYDSKSGLFGAVGHGTQGVLKAGFTVDPLQRNASNGDTNVLVNGREITRTERDYLVSVFNGDAKNPQQYAGSYELDSQGNLTHHGQNIGNVVQAAKAKQAKSSGSGDNGNTWYSKGGAMGGSAPGCSWVYIPNSTTGSSTSVSSGCD